jgi:predicted enzyme related to lactoylglutathione lyase
MALTARMVTIDCADPSGLAAFWSAATGLDESWRYENEFVILGAGAGIRLGLQRVPEPTPGKNRCHVDWAADDREVEVRRLVGLGATVVDEQKTPGLSWTVLQDPEGNEFCVSGPHR